MPVFCIKLTEFFLKICFIFCFVRNNTVPPNLIDEIVFILNHLYTPIAIVCGVDTWHYTRESNLNWFTGYLLIGSCLVHQWILGVLCLLWSSVCFIIWSVLNKIILNHLYIPIAIVCGVDIWNITRESNLNWFTGYVLIGSCLVHQWILGVLCLLGHPSVSSSGLFWIKLFWIICTYQLQLYVG